MHVGLAVPGLPRREPFAESLPHDVIGALFGCETDATETPLRSQPHGEVIHDDSTWADGIRRLNGWYSR